MTTFKVPLNTDGTMWESLKARGCRMGRVIASFTGMDGELYDEREVLTPEGDRAFMYDGNDKAVTLSLVVKARIFTMTGIGTDKPEDK